MKILVTGNLGYVGNHATAALAALPSAEITGVDMGIFEGKGFRSASRMSSTRVIKQIYKDIRDLGLEDLEGIHTVVHLAAISNDPIGEEFSLATREINLDASIRLAKMAARAGVSHFIFASSCSVYGAGSETARTEKDEVNPLTEYAKSKIELESELSGLTGPMRTTSLRFATACGPSYALRTDLVLNDFVWTALATSKIVILSDGSPWRPLIDVRDMAKVISWMAEHRLEATNEQHVVVNAGSDTANYQVKEIAERVANLIPNLELEINTNAAPDKRSYKVDFSYFDKLTSGGVTFLSLEESIQGLIDLIREQGFDLDLVNMAEFKRLSIIRTLKANGLLSETLRWQ